ncbi:MAG: hypothetical protein K0M50_05450 [Prolixibacteraceae bacterium]|nr:hypothetical protein [Prolixibacteraceae bacterium]
MKKSKRFRWSVCSGKGWSICSETGGQFHRFFHIRKNLTENKGETIIYDFEDFMYVLDVGLKSDYFGHLPVNDYSLVVNGIEINYQ